MILQNDSELRPLIFEHETLLKSLTCIADLKAESMLSILTAAETEMYENSKSKEDQEKLLDSNRKLSDERDYFFRVSQTATEEYQKLQEVVKVLKEENKDLKASLEKEQQRVLAMEKEQECGFKNL